MDTRRIPVAFAAAIAGALLGGLAVLAVRPEPLRPVIIALLAFAAAVVLLRSHVKARPRTPAHPQLALAAIALGLGAYDGFFGPGVGSMIIVAFMLVYGDGITAASGNAKIVNLASNVASMTLFAARGTILWKVSLPMAVGNALGAAVGARLALRKGDRLVRWVVLAVVVAAMAKLAVDFARG